MEGKKTKNHYISIAIALILGVFLVIGGIHAWNMDPTDIDLTQYKYDPVHRVYLSEGSWSGKTLKQLQDENRTNRYFYYFILLH